MNIGSTQKAKYLHDILKQELESNKYAIGEKLPSVRDLSTMYNVNKSTVVTVLATLASEGLIRTEAGKGAFVLEPKTEPKQIAALFFDSQSPLRVDTEILGHIQRNMKPGYFLSLHDTSQNYKVFENTIARLVESGVKAIIAIPPKFYTPGPSEVEYLNRLLGDTIPLVFIIRNIEGVNAEYFSMDLSKGIQKAVTYLNSIGKKNICLIKHDSQKFIDEELAGLEFAAQQYNLQINPKYLLEYDDNIERIGNILGSIIHEVDAIIGPDHTLCSLQGVIRGTSKQFPEQLSIVGINDVVSHYFAPPLTSIRFPVEHIGVNAVQTAIARIEGTMPPERIVKNFIPDLVIRET
ncbi:GntR family transcriptional regulator [Paenibacillus thalictri]|uniref:GntR family transcriptional regulator n=1 Tax=Paenibacillus thalictri TaxID=2527873 RepID=A0A4Q9DSU7_9BACL|nr:GntR family transcriptional regulator [Paenibacillus thalictri]TBL79045.1 GntR family transcriptional regulator [Paenibacillus thalictri]